MVVVITTVKVPEITTYFYPFIFKDNLALILSMRFKTRFDFYFLVTFTS